MKIRNTMLVAISCLAAAAAFGQGGGGSKGIAGSWGTDAAIAHLANAAAPAAGGQSVMLILKVDSGNKVTGSIAEFGNALCGKPDTNLPIDSGMVEGKMVTFVTTRPACPAAAASVGGTFSGTGVGNNFVVQGQGGGGGGRGAGGGGGPVQITWTGTLGDDDVLTVTRGGGGRGGGRGGPGAGAPPANNFVQGQGGGGGGRGGGGRGGGGGALIMHRIP